MSSKTKMSKFKNAVASNSSTSSSSSSGSTTLTITQANTLQALHQEQLARLSSAILPNLASLHSRRFLTLARSQTQAADAMWSTQKLQSVNYRKALWAEDIEPESSGGGEKAKDGTDRIVPDFYHKHNGRCPKCALPLVPGLNHVSIKRKEKGKIKTKSSSKIFSTRKRSYTCTLCHHKTRT